MKVLVINCGSSSLKYQLIDMENENLLAKGLADRIGINGSLIEHETIGKEKKIVETAMDNHQTAVEIILDTLVDPEFGVLKSMDEIGAVGHRVVHGGEKFSASALITDEVMKGIEESAELAPLHNPPNITGINACKKILPNTPMVAVFDTAYHQTMPESSFMYALPYELYEKYKIRRYGFHGTSHKFVAYRAAELIGKPIEELKIITCHLGNGASVSAIEGGKSIDTSMGFTPLQGLAMGTRSGDLDPAIVTYLMKKENLTYDQMDEILNKKSGVLGISGISNDFRDLEAAAEEGNERAQLALDIYYKIVVKYIGAYTAEMGGLDAIVFTAGLGENSPKTRMEICKAIEFLGLTIDEDKNSVRGQERILTTDDSKVKVLLIPTNEELAIARETVELL